MSRLMEFGEEVDRAPTCLNTTIPLQMKRSVLSSSSLSENSNGMSTLSTLWSDGFPSVGESLDLLTDEEVEPQHQTQHYTPLFIHGGGKAGVVVPASSSPAKKRSDLEERIDLIAPTWINRPVSDLRKYKTTLCRSWRASSLCTFGTDCVFAHGEAELRSETNNETLKLAHELLGGLEERVPRRRTRRRNRRRGCAPSAELSNDEAADEEPTPQPLPTAHPPPTAGASAPPGILGDGAALPCLCHAAPSSSHPQLSLGSVASSPHPAPFPLGLQEASGALPLLLAQPPNTTPQLAHSTTHTNCIRGICARLQLLEHESAVLREHLNHHLNGALLAKNCQMPPRPTPPAAQYRSPVPSAPFAPLLTEAPLPRTPPRPPPRALPLAPFARGPPPPASPDVVVYVGSCPRPTSPGTKDLSPSCFLTKGAERFFSLPPSLGL
eukprot:EG_transcript_3773